MSTVENTLEWMTECTLATVEMTMSKKRHSQRELNRQINIAAAGLKALEYKKVGGRLEAIRGSCEGSERFPDHMEKVDWAQAVFDYYSLG